MLYRDFLRRSPWPLYILAALLPASYLPTLQLGTFSGVHIDVSLLYVVLTVFVCLYLPRLWQERTAILSSWPCRLLIVFGMWQSLTLFWTPNLFRGMATTLFAWLLIVTVFSLVAQRSVIWRTKRGLLIAAGIGVGVSCLMALWQVFADALGVSPVLTGLPDMYRSDIFGVARPTGLALEPQFLASILIAPLLFGVWRLSAKPFDWRVWAGTVLVGTIMLLTLSRGGIGAVGIGTLILLVTVTARASWQRVAIVATSGVAALVFSLAVTGLVGTLNTQDGRDGYDTVRAAVSQLSLGTIALPAPSEPMASPTTSKNVHITSRPREDYVERSTTSRLSMSQTGISLWSSSPSSVLFGVGTGGFGAALGRTDASYTPGTVVNNYYVELLAELGLIGILLWLALIGTLVWELVRRQWWLGLAVIVSFSLQWYFFSGNANVIHVWVGIGCLAALLSRHNFSRI